MDIQESIRKINAQKAQAENELKERKNKAQETEILLDFLTQSFAELVKQIATGKYDVNVKFPVVQTVNGKVSVDGMTSLLQAIQELNYSTKKNKLTLPNVQKVEGTVTIANPTPETRIPEFPTKIETEVLTLPDYVETKLDEIKKELSKIELSPNINVQNEAPQVSIDLDGVKNLLESLVEEIRRIQVTPEVNIDLSKVVDASDKTTQAVNNLKFPIPNFHSSYDHSLSMRVEDMDKAFAYTTDDSKKVIESITVRDVDGGAYRKTYTYSGDGSGDPITETKWERV